jgi:hypothetical protein
MSRADNHFERDGWFPNQSPQNYKLMVVEFNTGGVNYIPLRQAKTYTASAPAAADSSVSLGSSQQLQESLKQSSTEVRPDKVAAATALVNDSDYPSDATLNRLAGFLAGRI